MSDNQYDDAIWDKIFGGFNPFNSSQGNYYCFDCGQRFVGMEGGKSLYCPSCTLKRAKAHIFKCSFCNRECFTKDRPDQRFNICSDCWSDYIPSEQRRLKNHLARAKRAGTQATLTLKEWVESIKFFGDKCAYCQETHFEVMEHILPISKGGGTTIQNCLPACTRCNNSKADNLNPKQMNLDAAKKIAEYLSSHF